MHSLKLLKQQCMPQNELYIVCNYIIVNRITFDLPAWAVFMTVDLTNSINKSLKQNLNMGYVEQRHNISILIEHVDDKLFRSIRSPAHCAHLLPDRPAVRTIMPRGHDIIHIAVMQLWYVQKHLSVPLFVF